MVFNSSFFFLTLVPFLALYLAVRSWNVTGAKILTLAYSYFFYGMWNPVFVILILVSTVVDHRAAIAIRRWPSMRGRFLAASLTVNLGLLGFFKYYNFFSSGMLDILSTVGISWSVPQLDVLLPIGISFYTFQTLSYTLDVYSGRLQARSSFLDIAFYVAFFPQLVAGPIVRASQFLPQAERGAVPTYESFSRGMTCIILGLFTKCVIADNVALRVDILFDGWVTNGVIENWMAAMLFGVQIWGDFSGYSLIAIGIASFMGYEIPRNFNSPYGARGFSDFWRRWHISLSTWFRDYLYIPLGGNRRAPHRVYLNLMITMLLGGLWHGASWPFVVWGGLHGCFLCMERLLQKRDSRSSPDGEGRTKGLLPGILLTFAAVSISWIPFRAQTLEQSLAMMKGLVIGEVHTYAGLALDAACVGFVFAAHVLWRNRDFAASLNANPRALFFSLTAMLLGLYYLSGDGNVFIYFRF